MRRKLSEKFFYQSPESVKAWLALCRRGDYKNFRRSKEVIGRSARPISSRIEKGLLGRRLSVVSLGSGQGDKDLILLKAFRAKGLQASYLAVDTSRLLLQRAVQGASEASFPSQGIEADLTRVSQLKKIVQGTQPPRLFLLLGNTLGGFDPLNFLRNLTGAMGPGDLLLVDGEIFDGKRTLKGYDNPINRRFVWASLHSLGIGRKEGKLNFEIGTDARRKGIFFVRKFFVLHAKKSSVIEMSRSWKYSRDAFRRLLKEEAGLSLLGEYLSCDRRLVLFLSAKGKF